MGVEIFDKRVSNDKYSKMKLFWFLAALAIAEEVDDMGNKKNKVDKGPRECAGHGLSDSDDGSKLWKCRSRNPDNKNPHLTKRCKLECKKGKKRGGSGNSKVYCYAGKGWVLRKSETVITPGDCVYASIIKKDETLSLRIITMTTTEIL